MIIKIPFKTPSANKLYGKTFRHNSVYLRPEAKKLKQEIHDIVIHELAHNYDLGKHNIFRVVIEIHEDWYYKNGNVKKMDLANREKFLIDSVFEAIGIDDKNIFEYTMKKIQDKEEYANITIECLEKQE